MRVCLTGDESDLELFRVSGFSQCELLKAQACKGRGPRCSVPAQVDVISNGMYVTAKEGYNIRVSQLRDCYGLNHP